MKPKSSDIIIISNKNIAYITFAIPGKAHLL